MLRVITIPIYCTGTIQMHHVMNIRTRKRGFYLNSISVFLSKNQELVHNLQLIKQRNVKEYIENCQLLQLTKLRKSKKKI